MNGGSEEGRGVTTWPQLQQELIGRFEISNKNKFARDRLARWRQIKDFAAYSEDFQKILLYIPNITTEEQVDHYARGLKSYNWRELCTKKYRSRREPMKDEQRVEMAHRLFGRAAPRFVTSEKRNLTESTEPVPMEIGDLQLKS